MPPWVCRRWHDVCTVPKPFPKEFREDVVRVYRNSDASIAQVPGGPRSRRQTHYANNQRSTTRDGEVEADMSDTSVPRDTLRVTTCDTDETLAAARGVFNQYRHHYGEPPDADERTLGWLTDMVQSNMLTVYTASVDSPADAPAIGLATGHAVPASLVMGQFWQLRDLYVLPGSRRQGAAAALVSAVREAALAAGATRLSLVTEPDNQAALGLYRRLGFRPTEGLASLSLDLAPQEIRE